MGLKIGEVAKRTGVNLQTIRYYERDGLLPEPPRRSSGYRAFPESTVRRIRFIKRAQELGFSLAEIRDLLSLRLDRAGRSSAVRALASAKLTDIEAKIHTLEAMRAVLRQLMEKCTSRGPAAECPILESIDSEETLP